MKKLLSVLLTAVIVLSLSVAVFAAEGNSITVQNAVEGETYNLYKLFDLSISDDGTAYTYTIKSDSPWYAFFADGGNGSAFVTLTENGENEYVANVKKSSAEQTDADWAAELAGLAISYANANAVAAIDHKTGVADSDTVVFEGLALGYYMVETTVGTLVALDSNNANTVITPKHPNPTITKLVKEDSTDEWGTTNTADIGDTVNYSLTLAYVQNLKNLTAHDVMSAGLTLDSSTISVKLDGADLASGTDYTLITDNTSDADCDFEVSFPVSLLDTLTSSNEITVNYSATVNESAVIGSAGNPNEATLTYGDSSVTDKALVITYVYDLDILKYTAASDNNKAPLAGAMFVLKNADGNFATVADGKLTGWVASEDAATVLVSGADGKIHIDGLDAASYQLVETEAPAGYNKLSDPIEIVIAENGELSVGGSAVTTVEVENRYGTELPTTGGIGTTIFVTVGAIGVIVLGVFLVTNKRMKREEF